MPTLPSEIRAMSFRLVAAALAGVLAAAMPAEAACSLRWPALARGVSAPGVDGSGARAQASDAILRTLRAGGMRHVRLPVKAENLMARFADAATRQATLADARAAYGRLRRFGFAVVLDLHGGEAMNALLASDPAAAGDAIVEAWGRLAPIVVKAPAGMAFAEVLNEPGIEDASWAAVLKGVLPRLRTLMPKTPLVVSLGGPQRADVLVASAPPVTGNVVYAVHYYDPFAFTHQGAGFADAVLGVLHGIPFPFHGDDPRVLALEASLRAAGYTAAADYLASVRAMVFDGTRVGRDLAAVAAWGRRNRVPVILGEFGVLADDAPAADRALWLRTVARRAEASCLGWTHWSLTGGFGMIDPATGALDRPTLGALLPATAAP
ncbi:glycoside hydrolase family 5 protein [Oharaeibacter diazotrophicus]|uniref:Exo-1,3-beta-glucanase D n=1 Tax=Oharaeibacter diazotrophicus TaxID=1920512 RepID=A0A4V3CVN6_9HYPH|nr:cellulase family glycosylhydrolase [Oharaeibacter diazotrophicus]TDP83188.1 endoglucanase [Oharaeibacter diazotrophicus]BBE72017.1 endoglucanase 3 precursor [Pleomorphomonas sp. SM30]GLS78782.1 endoglucanase [Oharaeibacter diazotrophicus]